MMKMNHLIINISSVLSLILIIYFTFLPCLDAPFTHDDGPSLNHPVAHLSAPLSYVWKRDYWGHSLSGSHTHHSFRPLTSLSFALSSLFCDTKVFHNDCAPSFRIVNLMLHTLSAILLWRVTMRATRKPLVSFFSAALFAAHPALTEPVCSVALRGDLIAGLTYLCVLEGSSLALISRGTDTRTGSSTLFFAGVGSAIGVAVIGILSKETAAPALLIGTLYAFFIIIAARSQWEPDLIGMDDDGLWSRYKHFFGWAEISSDASGSTRREPLKHRRTPLLLAAKKAPAVGLLFFILTILLSAARFFVISNGATPLFSPFENISVRLPFPSRYLTLAYLGARHFLLLLWPMSSTLAVDWSGFALIPVTSIYDTRNLLTLAITLLFLFVIFIALFTNMIWDELIADEMDSLDADERGIDGNESSPLSSRSHLISLNPPPLLLPPPLLTLFGMSWAMIAFAPACGLLVTPGFTIGQRVMYAPAMGVALASAGAISGLLEDKGGYGTQNILATVASVALAVAIDSARTAAQRWQSDASLWEGVLAASPLAPKAWHTLGVVAASKGDVSSALFAYRKAQNSLEDFVTRGIHPGLLIGDALFPDPYINEAQLLVHVAKSQGIEAQREAASTAANLYDKILENIAWQEKTKIKSSVEEEVQVVPTAATTFAILTELSQHCVPDGEIHARALTGSSRIATPIRIPERVILLAAAAFNGGVLREESQVDSILFSPSVSSLDHFLSASALLATADPMASPEARVFAGIWADRASVWGAFNIAARWSDREIKWTLIAAQNMVRVIEEGALRPILLPSFAGEVSPKTAAVHARTLINSYVAITSTVRNELSWECGTSIDTSEKETAEWCSNIPYLPSARTGSRGGTPSIDTRSISVLTPSTNTDGDNDFSCETPSDTKTPCGSVFSAASRAADAAASFFKEVRRMHGMVELNNACRCEENRTSSSLRVCVDESYARADKVSKILHSTIPVNLAKAAASVNHSYGGEGEGGEEFKGGACAILPDESLPIESPLRRQLNDFTSADGNIMTLTQAFYYARRAEGLARAWKVGEEHHDSSVTSSSQTQALVAATGPMVTLLNLCNCGAVGRM